MLRRVLLATFAVVLVACSPNSSCPTAKCTEGITFLVGEVAGSLSRGAKDDLQVCFDGKCQDTTVTRANVAGSIFLPFTGVAGSGDHTITVKATGGGSLQGEYKGKIVSYVQKPNGAKCPGSCSLATVKIGADGTITPGVPKSTLTTTTAPSGSTTTKG
jgi:hypothetical protein